MSKEASTQQTKTETRKWRAVGTLPDANSPGSKKAREVLDPAKLPMKPPGK